jgi:uncharacterized protein YdeI (YjbR/CyaY-like superfamily)
LRDPARSGIYAFEKETVSLDTESERQFRRNRKAWSFFQKQAPSYRQVVIHYVTSAKKPETRARRLAALIEHSALGERIPQYTITRKPK